MIAIRRRIFQVLVVLATCAALPLSAGTKVIGELSLLTDTNAVVEVAVGEETVIEKLSGDRGTITKTGGGMLRILLMRNTKVRFDIQGGKVFFDRQMPYVCADAFLHVDASRADTLELEEQNGTNFVVRWNDVRGNGMFATNCLAGPTWRTNPENRRAFISDVTQNGLPVVDFGPIMFKAYTNAVGEALGYGATMIWSRACTNAYEVYEVISDTPEVATIPNEYPQFKDKDGIWATSFLSSSLDRAGNYRERLGSKTYPNVFYDTSSNYGWAHGCVYHNGSLKAPNSQGTSGKFSIGEGFSLLGFTTREYNAEKNYTDYAARLNSFARDYNTTFGGQRLAEYLVFTNRLDSSDRAILQEYLNVKWRGGAVPPYTVSSLTVAPGASVDFAPGVSVKVANVSEGANLSVGNGSFELNPLLNPEAYFHVDADAVATLAIETQNGTNFVTRWDDALSNGVYATASTKKFGNWLPDPENRRPFISEEKLNNRAVVDFGPLQVASHTNAAGYGVGYGASMKWSSRMSSVARELWVVARDTEDVKTLIGNSNTKSGEHGQSYVCDPDTPSTEKGVCYRGELSAGKNPAITHDNSYNAPIKEGVSCIDGMALGDKWKSTALPDGFHVVNLQLTYNAHSPKPGWFAYSQNKDPQYAIGGTKIAEYLVFDHPLEATVRTNIYTALRTKWFDDARTVRTFGNLTIDVGANMSIPWNDVVVTNCLVFGGGLTVSSVKAAALHLTASGANVSGGLEIEDGATIMVDTFADGSFASLSAEELKLSGGGKVVFNALAGVKPRIGETKILGEFTGSLENWSVDASGITSVFVTLKEKEDGIYAVVSPKGTVVLVR